MNPQGFVRREIGGDDLAAQLDKGLTLPGQFLQEKTFSAEDPRA